MAKFLVVHPNMDIYGGGERVCHHILKTLDAHEQAVELLTFNFDQSLYSEIMGEKIPSKVMVTTIGNRSDVEAKPPLSVYKRRQNILALIEKYKQASQYDFTFSTQTLSAFETTLFEKAKENIAYVHFPEIHYDYDHSNRGKQMYLWLYKRLLERKLPKLDLIFCNSNYTKTMIQKYWDKFGIKDPIVAYPPVEEPFWSTNPLEDRVKRVLYVGRFVPQKRHELMKRLAVEFPRLDFVSAGLLRDSEESWFARFKKDLPHNYVVMPNLSEEELIELFHNSQIYCHLMEGEHFGIAPMEALVSGCITFVHDSGGSREFFPPEFRWTTFEDLKLKMAQLIDVSSPFPLWNKQKDKLHERISILRPKKFEDQIWSYLETLIQKAE